MLEIYAVRLSVKNRYAVGELDAVLFRVTSSVLNYGEVLLRYLRLRDENERLIAENIRLRNKVMTSRVEVDDWDQGRFRYMSANIVNNSIINSRNHITIDRGSIDGVRVGMGLFTERGVVGFIKHVSDNFSLAVSLLNTDVWVSAKISSSDYIGSVRWVRMEDSSRVNLLHIPRRALPKVGDKVVTSGYGDTFPEGMEIGEIVKINLEPGGSFYEIEVSLGENFATVRSVYLVENVLLEEQRKLEEIK